MYNPALSPVFELLLGHSFAYAVELEDVVGSAAVG